MKGYKPSPHTKNQYMMRIYNNSVHEIEAHWVNFLGNTRYYGTIEPGHKSPWTVTYLDHVWRIIDAKTKGTLRHMTISEKAFSGKTVSFNMEAPCKN
jgi:hypothetical protein